MEAELSDQRMKWLNYNLEMLDQSHAFHASSSDFLTVIVPLVVPRGHPCCVIVY